MKYKAYVLSSRLSPEETVARVGQILTKAGVQYKVEGLAIVSTRMPIPLGVRNNYSDRNWVGMNPFTSVSGIEVRCQPARSGMTQVTVQVNRLRTFLFVALWASSAGAAAAGTIKRNSDIVFVAVGLVAGFSFGWLMQVSLLAGYLLKKEIASALNSRTK